MQIFSNQVVQSLGSNLVAKPVELRILELAELTVELTGIKSLLIVYPLPMDDPKQM